MDERKEVSVSSLLSVTIIWNSFEDIDIRFFLRTDILYSNLKTANFLFEN